MLTSKNEGGRHTFNGLLTHVEMKPAELLLQEPRFSLHLHEAQILSAWYITIGSTECWELFNNKGHLVLQLLTVHPIQPTAYLLFNKSQDIKINS
ncbi:hypothetical protein BWI97_25650 [Siphonobacter sp. BAB-5405]|uniref:hypothetical protein n=1 Tax=Siphonobacter sp. BAB-5405 TaxID=1864825 RepID=UPI000C804832|nr:hypothetical protein BWI97_25650 [Siphonobacter sp. BAB-5405]